jgi:hypothetical protein
MFFFTLALLLIYRVLQMHLPDTGFFSVESGKNSLFFLKLYYHNGYLCRCKHKEY